MEHEVEGCFTMKVEEESIVNVAGGRNEVSSESRSQESCLVIEAMYCICL